MGRSKGEKVDGKQLAPRRLMEAAIDEMRKSKSEGGKPTPLVGAVAVLPDGQIVTSHRSEMRNGDHAEYTLFERKLQDKALDGAILFVTLEPCAPGARSTEKTACAKRVVDARVAEVWIGLMDPDPRVDGMGRAYLEANGVKVHDFDPDLREAIAAANSDFLDYAAGRGPGRAVPDRVRKLVGDPRERMELSDCIQRESARVRKHLEGSQPTELTEYQQFAAWLDRLTDEVAPLVEAFALVGAWGDADDVPTLLRALEPLCRWHQSGGVVVTLNARMYPALLALYACGVAAVASGRYRIVAALLRGRLPMSALPYPRPDEMVPVPQVLNAPTILHRAEMLGIKNIGNERRADHPAPESVFLEARLRPLLADIVRDDGEFERAFDTFDAMLGLR